MLEKYPFEIERKSGSHVIVRHPCLVGHEKFGIHGEFSIAIKGGQKVKGIYLQSILDAIRILEEEN